jgi:hypothetical protein
MSSSHHNLNQRMKQYCSKNFPNWVIKLKSRNQDVSQNMKVIDWKSATHARTSSDGSAGVIFISVDDIS